MSTAEEKGQFATKTPTFAAYGRPRGQGSPLMQPVAPVKDEQTVTATWEPVRRQIAGVVVKRLPPLEDERGEICEMYRPAWGIHPAPLVYVYQVMIRPGKIKGW
ncbi:MAG: hypothetical protein ICV72_14765 [Aldersonia sp.]|nr:hypothetical protein [Aldersonia sp.]